MAVYRPRFVARLFVPNVGSPSERVQQDELDDVTQLQVRCHRVRLVSNSHNEADECEIEGTYDDLGIDPRFLKSLEMYLHAGDADSAGEFTPSAENLRFLGIATDVERMFDENSKGVRIRALDYTTLFIAAKQFPPSGIPDFSQNLTDAWRRVCDNTGHIDIETGTVVSTVQRLRDNLEFVGIDPPGPVLGSAVGARIAKLGKLQVKHGTDAWDVWQTAVMSMGLISFIRGDRCIVTTATDYYTAADPPRFAYGLNILKLRERRDGQSMSGKNVCIESFDPLKLQTIEAFWPPLSLAQKQKKPAASALGAPLAVRAQDYEVLDCPVGITDPKALERFAERVWEERSRQELRGELVTREMEVETLNGNLFDMLALQSGDRIRVEVDREALTQIQRLGSLSQREQALRERGYSDDMVVFITKNLDAITKMTPEFQVHSVETEIEATNAESPRYEQRIEFLNRIDVSGSADPGTGGPPAPAVTGQKATK